MTLVLHEQLIDAIDGLYTNKPRRVVVLTPGDAATAKVQAAVAGAGRLGVRVCGPDALLPAVLPVGSELGRRRVRTPGFWRDVVAQVHARWPAARQSHHALELFEADLTGEPAATLAADLDRGRTPESISLIEALGPRPPAIVVYGFASEEQPVDLPAPLDALIPAIEAAGVEVVEVEPASAAPAERQQAVFLAADRLSEVVAVTEAVERSGLSDVAIVVPDEGAYEAALVSRLGARGIATRTGRIHRIAETPAGRWLRTFLLAAEDRFARPLLIDLMEQLAAWGALEADEVIALDRLSRREWVLDQRHWRRLCDTDRLAPATRDAVGVVLDAGDSLQGDDPAAIERLLGLLRGLDGASELGRVAGPDAAMSNRLRIRRMLGAQLAPRDDQGIAIHRLSEAFGLTETTVYVLGLDTTATYRHSQAPLEISRFKAKRRSWVWLTRSTRQLIVTAPLADLAGGDRLEVSAWVNDLDGDRSLVPSADVLRSALPGTAATSRQVDWIERGPDRRIDVDLTEHRWSPSQIDTHQRCPLQWMLKYRLKVPRTHTPESDDAFDPATRGTVVHRVLEEHAADTEHRTFEQLLREAIGEELAENALRDGDPFLELMITDLARRIRVGHEAIERELALGFGTTEARERDVETAVACGDRSVHFRGKIDRVIETPAGRIVLDYKSSKWRTSEMDLSSAPASGEHLQLWLYALMLEAAGEAAAGHQELALAFPLAKVGRNQPRVSRVRAAGTDPRMRKVTRGIEALVAAAEVEPLAVAQQGSGSPCRYCDVADACPQRHRSGPAHDPRRFFQRLAK